MDESTRDFAFSDQRSAISGLIADSPTSSGFSSSFYGDTTVLDARTLASTFPVDSRRSNGKRTRAAATATALTALALVVQRDPGRMSCCTGTKNEERDEPTRVRGCTDVFWLCIFIAFWFLMVRD